MSNTHQNTGSTPIDPNRFRRHLTDMVKLALPVIFSRTGILLLGVADFAILGRSSPAELAFFTLGQSPFVILMVISIGLMLGTLIATSHAMGEENFAETGAVWRRSLPFALIIGCLFAGACMFGEIFFRLVEQPEDLIKQSAEVTFILGLSLIPTVLFLTSTFFLEAIKRPRVVILFIIVANILNVIGNVLVVDTYGAIGVAWITTASRLFLGIGLSIYIWMLKDHKIFSIRDKPSGGWIRGGMQQRRHGYASGISMAFESIAFGVMSIYAGWLGVNALAVFGVSMNLLSLCFMLAVGVATATGVRVGIAHGRKDINDRTLAGWIGFGLILLLLTPISALLIFVPESILSLYLTDEALIISATTVLFLIAFINFGDGGQVVLQSSLRGSSDRWIPTMIAFTSYFLVMLPLGYVFTQIIPNGVYGLFQAIAYGSAFSVVLLLCRWIYLTRKNKL